jgi:serine phosphatase RsbU (regulator of sigma subunit)
LAHSQAANVLSERLPEIPGLEIGTGAFIPNQGVIAPAEPPGRSWTAGGSFLDVFELQDSFGIAWGDVRGMGQLDSMVPMAKYALKVSAMRMSSPEMVASHLGRVVYPWPRAKRTVSMLYGRFEPASATLTLTNCSPWPPILMREGATTLLNANGPRLGEVPPPDRYPQIVVRLLPGDVLVGYTSGLPETLGGGHNLGIGKVRRVLEVNSDANSTTLVRKLLALARDHSGAGSGSRETFVIVIRVPAERP